ncbi:hypothetical protein FOL47_004642 [Perkinsus chesapeaki]|uniref:PDZ domain-containing protein n=1 Tax=Perkinsus chesapeaki TaxID=330153 RepID=A0A7J6M1L5_PERCH|nr:hypothetical protein FOL47_004642 [Perkinsus chesapeaki]
MSSFGELIAALQSVKSVKDKRQAIRSLAAQCASRMNVMKILRAGGWSKAIQPLLSSLDPEAQVYAALAAANLTSFDISHDFLAVNGAIPELLRVAHESDEPDLAVYGLTALGNLAGTSSTRQAMLNYKVKVAALFVLSNLSGCPMHREIMIKDLKVHEAAWKDLFDPSPRVMAQALDVVRGLSVDSRAQALFPKMGILPYLATILKTKVDKNVKASNITEEMRLSALDVLTHVSFNSESARMILESPECVDVVAKLAALGGGDQVIEGFANDHSLYYVEQALCIIANELSDQSSHSVIMDGSATALYEALRHNVDSAVTSVVEHVLRAYMHLSMTTRYHDQILQTGLISGVVMVAMHDQLPLPMRVCAVQLMASLSATSPTAPSGDSVQAACALLAAGSAGGLDMEGGTRFDKERSPVERNLHRQLRRYAAMTVANCAAAADNVDHIIGTHRDDAPYLKAMLSTLSSTQDPVLMSHIIRCFHNMVNNSPPRCGRILIDAGLLGALFLNPTNITKESLRRSGMVSEDSKLDRYLGYDKIPQDDEKEDHMEKLMKEDEEQLGDSSQAAPLLLLEARRDNPLIFQKILTHWEASQLKDRRLAPHVALLCSTTAFEEDCQGEFLLQGGVRLAVKMYEEHFPEDEYVRLCCVLSILYIVSPPASPTQDEYTSVRAQEEQKSAALRGVAMADGLKMLLAACENETHVEIVANALKALMPFAESELYRPIIGGPSLRGIDIVSSYSYSDNLELKQIAIFLLQHLLTSQANRRSFLALDRSRFSEEGDAHGDALGEDDLEGLVDCLPIVRLGVPKKIRSKSESGSSTLDISGVSNIFAEGLHDPFVLKCAVKALALLSQEKDIRALSRIVDYKIPVLLHNIFYSGQIDEDTAEAIVVFTAEMCQTNDKTLDAMVKLMNGQALVKILLTYQTLNLSPSTRLVCLGAMNVLARHGKHQGLLIEFLPVLATTTDTLLFGSRSPDDSEELDEQTRVSGEKAKDATYHSTCAVLASILCEFSASINELVHTILLSCNAVNVFLALLNTVAVPKVRITSRKEIDDTLLVELLITATVGISNLVSGVKGKEFVKELLNPAAKVQYLTSLFQLSSEKVLRAFYSGTTGLKAIQRNLKADITPDELEASSIVPFTEFKPTLHPHVLVCRHILRTLCICGLFHIDFLLSALPARVLLATCQTSMASDDSLMRYLGVSLVSILSASRPMAMEFAKVPFIVNSVINRMKAKLGQPGFSSRNLLNATSTQGRALVVSSSNREGATRWPTQATEFYAFVSALVCIIRIGEIVKDYYSSEIDRRSLARQLRRKRISGGGGGVLGRIQATNQEKDDANEQDSSTDFVSQTNLNFLVTLPAAMLAFIDIEALGVLLHKYTATSLHNTDDDQLDHQERRRRSSVGEGGSDGVHKSISIGPLDGVHEVLANLGYLLIHQSLTGQQIDKDDKNLVPLEIRAEIASIEVLQHKTEAILALVKTFVRHTTEAVMGISCSLMDTLIRLTYVCPNAFSKQGVPKILEMLKICPLVLQQRLCVLLANVNSIEATETEESVIDRAVASTGGFLERLLFNTNDSDVRRYLAGSLANLMSMPVCVASTLRGSAVLRLCTERVTWDQYVTNFGLHLQLARLLSNIAGNSPTALKDPLIMRYIFSAVRLSYRLVTKLVPGEDAKVGEEEEEDDDESNETETFTLTFTEVDVPRIGLKISWQSPYPVVKHVMPEGAADRRGEVREGDLLIAINDDTEVVTKDYATCIEPLLLQRPLKLTLRHPIQKTTNVVEDPVEDVILAEEAAAAEEATYLECFQLLLETLQALSGERSLQEVILAEEGAEVGPIVEWLVSTFITSDGPSGVTGDARAIARVHCIQNRKLAYTVVANMCKSAGVSQELSTTLVKNIKMEATADNAGLSAELVSDEEIAELEASKVMQKMSLYASSLYFHGIEGDRLGVDPEALELIIRLSKLQLEAAGGHETLASASTAGESMNEESTLVMSIITEIFHKLSQSSREDIRNQLYSRQVFITLKECIGLSGRPDIQRRAYEVLYNMAITPVQDIALWEEFGLLLHAVKVARLIAGRATKDGKQESREHADRVWILLLRSCLALLSAEFSNVFIAALHSSEHLHSFLKSHFARLQSTQVASDSSATRHELCTVVGVFIQQFFTRSSEMAASKMWAQWRSSGLVELFRHDIGRYLEESTGEDDASFDSVCWLLAIGIDRSLMAAAECSSSPAFVGALGLRATRLVDFLAPPLHLDNETSDALWHAPRGEIVHRRFMAYMLVMTMVLTLTSREHRKGESAERLRAMGAITETLMRCALARDQRLADLASVAVMEATRESTVTDTLSENSLLSAMIEGLNKRCENGAMEIVNWSDVKAKCVATAISRLCERSPTKMLSHRRQLLKALSIEPARLHEDFQWGLHRAVAYLARHSGAEIGDSMALSFEQSANKFEDGELEYLLSCADWQPASTLPAMPGEGIRDEVRYYSQVILVQACTYSDEFCEKNKYHFNYEYVADHPEMVSDMNRLLTALHVWNCVGSATSGYERALTAFVDNIVQNTQVDYSDKRLKQLLSALLRTLADTKDDSMWVERMIRTNPYYELLNKFIGDELAGKAEEVHDITVMDQALYACIRYLTLSVQKQQREENAPWTAAMQPANDLHRKLTQWIPLGDADRSARVRYRAMQYLGALAAYEDMCRGYVETEQMEIAEAELLSRSVAHLLRYEQSSEYLRFLGASLLSKSLAKITTTHALLTVLAVNYKFHDEDGTCTPDDIRKILSLLVRDHNAKLLTCEGLTYLLRLAACDIEASREGGWMEELLGFMTETVDDSGCGSVLVAEGQADRLWAELLCEMVKMCRTLARKWADRDDPDLYPSITAEAILYIALKAFGRFHRDLELPGRLPGGSYSILQREMLRDILYAVQTLMVHYKEGNRKVKWFDVDCAWLETVLEIAQKNLYGRGDTHISAELGKVIYVIVISGFKFTYRHFPELLGECAYGANPDTEDAKTKEVASVSNAVFTTPSGGDEVTYISRAMTKVFDNVAAFILRVRDIKDERQRLWHYRAITSWTRMPKIVEQIVASHECVEYILELLKDNTFAKYSAVIVHSISVVRSDFALRHEGFLETVIECYFASLGREVEVFGQIVVQDSQMKLTLPRLLLATVRHALLQGPPGDEELSLSPEMLSNVLEIFLRAPQWEVPLLLPCLFRICSEGGPEVRKDLLKKPEVVKKLWKVSVDSRGAKNIATASLKLGSSKGVPYCPGDHRLHKSDSKEKRDTGSTEEKQGGPRNLYLMKASRDSSKLREKEAEQSTQFVDAKLVEGSMWMIATHCTLSILWSEGSDSLGTHCDDQQALAVVQKVDEVCRWALSENSEGGGASRAKAHREKLVSTCMDLLAFVCANAFVVPDYLPVVNGMADIVMLLLATSEHPKCHELVTLMCQRALLYQNVAICSELVDRLDTLPDLAADMVARCMAEDLDEPLPVMRCISFIEHFTERTLQKGTHTSPAGREKCLLVFTGLLHGIVLQPKVAKELISRTPGAEAVRRMLSILNQFGSASKTVLQCIHGLVRLVLVPHFTTVATRGPKLSFNELFITTLSNVIPPLIGLEVSADDGWSERFIHTGVYMLYNACVKAGAVTNHEDCDETVTRLAADAFIRKKLHLSLARLLRALAEILLSTHQEDSVLKCMRRIRMLLSTIVLFGEGYPEVLVLTRDDIVPALTSVLKLPGYACSVFDVHFIGSVLMKFRTAKIYVSTALPVLIPTLHQALQEVKRRGGFSEGPVTQTDNTAADGLPENPGGIIRPSGNSISDCMAHNLRIGLQSIAKIASGGDHGDEDQEKQIASLVTSEILKLMFEVLESDPAALLAVLAVLCVGGGQRAQLKLFEFGIVEKLNKIASVFSASASQHLQLEILWVECGTALLSTSTELRRRICAESPSFVRQCLQISRMLVSTIKPESRSVARVYGTILPSLIGEAFRDLMGPDCSLLCEEDRKLLFDTVLLPLVARSYSANLRDLCYKTISEIAGPRDVVHSSLAIIAAKAMRGNSSTSVESAAECVTALVACGDTDAEALSRYYFLRHGARLNLLGSLLERCTDQDSSATLKPSTSLALLKLFTVLTQDDSVECIEYLMHLKRLDALIGLVSSRNVTRRQIAKRWLVDFFHVSESQLLVIGEAASRSTHEALLTLSLHASTASRTLLRRTFFVYVMHIVDDMLDLRFGKGLDQYLNAGIIDLLTNLCVTYKSRGGGDALTEAFIYKLLQWAVTEKRNGLLESMLNSDVLMKFLLDTCLPSVADPSALAFSIKAARLITEILMTVPEVSSRKLISDYGLLVKSLTVMDVWPPCVTTVLVKVISESVVCVGGTPWERSARLLSGSPGLGHLLIRLIARWPHRIHSRVACQILSTLARIPQNQSKLVAEASLYVSKQSSMARSLERNSLERDQQSAPPMLWELYRRLLVVMREFKEEVTKRTTGPEHWDSANHHRELTLLLVIMGHLLNEEILGQHVLHRLIIGALTAKTAKILVPGLAPFAAGDTSKELVELLLDCWHRLPIPPIPPTRSPITDSISPDTMRNAKYVAFSASRALHVLCNVTRHKPIWVSMLHDADVAASVASGLHRVFTSPASMDSFWTVEDCRMAIRLVLISAHSVSVNTHLPTDIPNDFRASAMTQTEVESYLVAHRLACDHLLTSDIMLAMLSSLDRHPDPPYGDRALLRLLTTLIGSGGFRDPVTGPEISSMSAAKFLSMPSELSPDIQARRVIVGLSGPLEPAPAQPSGQWLLVAASQYPKLVLGTVTRLIVRCMSSEDERTMVQGCVAASCLIVLMDARRGKAHFLSEFVDACSVQCPVQRLMDALQSASYPTHGSLLTLFTLITTLRLPVTSETVTSTFLNKYWHLVGDIIHNLVTFDIDNKLYPVTTPHPLDHSQPLPASIPFGLFFHYLHHTTDHIKDPACRAVRDLVLNLLTTCISPPLREPPGLGAPRVREIPRSEEEVEQLAANVPPAPPLLMEMLAMYALQLTRQVDIEGKRMKDNKPNAYSSTLSSLANCMLALYNCVPHSPAAAMASAHLRAVSMSQLIRAGNNPIADITCISNKAIAVPEVVSALFLCDRHVRLLELCSLTLTCVRLGLGIIELSWGSCGYGSSLIAKQEGGRDLIAFMIKHIVKHFGGNSRAMTRVLASPWDKILYKEGVSLFVAKLFLDASGYEDNLEIIEMLGGQRALLALSRYSEDSIMRQQATVLLTKMAVMVAKSGVQDDDSSHDSSMIAGQ